MPGGAPGVVTPGRSMVAQAVAEVCATDFSCRTSPRRFCLDAPPHVGAGDVNELFQGDIVDRLAGPKLDVPHEPAGAFEQALGIRQLGAAKEADIHVIPERIDVTECGICDARRRMAVMQQLPNVVPAGTHDLEPAPCNRPQLPGMLAHPDLDGWFPLDRTVKPQKSAHFDACAK